MVLGGHPCLPNTVMLTGLNAPDVNLPPGRIFLLDVDDEDYRRGNRPENIWATRIKDYPKNEKHEPNKAMRTDNEWDVDTNVFRWVIFMLWIFAIAGGCLMTKCKQR